jgi:mono/diheme cytochrome c family protein
VVVVAAACTAAGSLPASDAAQSGAPAGDAAKRGEYIVKGMGCGDCHTPYKMGANGPEPDLTRMLSGHPAEMKLPPAPPPSGPWMASVAATMTAWAGPWGVSYTANLTPDPETGLGRWTEQQFVDTLRSGRHLGRGREILPPMPWPAIRNMTDEDLKAIFAYLRTIPAVTNRVPDPLPPADATK